MYFDPDSEIPISRSDASFVDTVYWLTKNDLMQRFPWLDFTSLKDCVSDYNQGTKDKNTDNDHTIMDTRNDTYKVIVRHYKTIKNTYYTLDDNFDKVPLEEPEAKELFKAGGKINFKPVETLNIAIACPAWNNKEFIFNGKYFCQPRRQRTGEILFPIQEIVAESINGKIMGYIKPLIPCQLLINSAMTQLYDHLKQESGNNVITQRDNWETPEEALRYARERTSSGKTFFANKEKVGLNDVAVMAPKNGSMSNDNAAILKIALEALKEISSTPESLQGTQATGPMSGVLNEQLRQQASVQHKGFVNNIQKYLRNTAELVLAYLFEYRPQFANETFRIMNNPGTQDNPDAPYTMTMMETTGELDEAGMLKILNDPTVYSYDLVVSKSAHSESERMKNITALKEVLSAGVLANEPGMASHLVMILFDLLDIPTSIKDKIVAQASAMAQQQAQVAQLDQQGKAIANVGKIKGIEQAEAQLEIMGEKKKGDLNVTPELSPEE